MNKPFNDGIYDARKLGVPKTLLLGIQHMFAMFGATVLVPILTGLSISTTLLFAGLGTLLFHLITKRKVPAFLGSSFAFLGGYAAIAPLTDAAGNALDNSELLPYACEVLHLPDFFILSLLHLSKHSRSLTSMVQRWYLYSRLRSRSCRSWLPAESLLTI